MITSLISEELRDSVIFCFKFNSFPRKLKAGNKTETVSTTVANNNSHQALMLLFQLLRNNSTAAAAVAWYHRVGQLCFGQLALYGAPCVKLRNIKFCIIFLVKLRAISYTVAIYVYCCNMC